LGNTPAGCKDKIKVKKTTMHHIWRTNSVVILYCKKITRGVARFSGIIYGIDKGFHTKGIY